MILCFVVCTLVCITITQVIDHIIRSSIVEGGAELDEHTAPGKFIARRLPLHNREQLDYLYKVTY
jgi:hypothetical protein